MRPAIGRLQPLPLRRRHPHSGSPVHAATGDPHHFVAVLLGPWPEALSFSADDWYGLLVELRLGERLLAALVQTVHPETMFLERRQTSSKITTRNSLTNSVPPTATRTTVGDRSTDRSFIQTTAATPKNAALRRMVPKFCGLDT